MLCEPGAVYGELLDSTHVAFWAHTASASSDAALDVSHSHEQSGHVSTQMQSAMLTQAASWVAQMRLRHWRAELLVLCKCDES